MGNLFKDLKEILSESQILKNEPMFKHTTFKIGGNADFLVLPQNIQEIKKLIDFCINKKINYYVIGNGSNLLVSDSGFKGIIIKILKNFNDIKINQNKIKAKAGATLSSISRTAMQNSLSGFEFAAGIPGTIGGGVCMNAGAYGGELKDVISSVTVIDENQNIKVLNNIQCEFEYRNSKILKNKMTVLEVEIDLNFDDKFKIMEKMKNFNKTRNEKQPIEYPSAGSTFKRPKNNFAGKLIMEAGLAGKTIGGACISEKHCGFIINKGGATCSDVLKLADIACKEVFEKFGINLEKEIRLIGE